MKINGALFDLKGNVVYEKYLKIKKNNPLDSSIDLIVQLIEDLIGSRNLNDNDIFEIGISVFGIVIRCLFLLGACLQLWIHCFMLFLRYKGQ